MPVERTLAIIKPDAVSRGLAGEILTRIHQHDFKILVLKSLRLTKPQAEALYNVHRHQPFFPSLTEFMSSGKVVVMVLEGENAIGRWREVMGATDPAQAAPGTLRKQFGTDIEHNVVHGSDNHETAAFEVRYFFADYELI